MSGKKVLPIVHLVDTEGPLDEDIFATFETLRRGYGIDLAPTHENLRRIQRGEGLDPQVSQEIMRKFSPHRLGYNRTWDDVDRMCRTIFSPQWRAQFKDSFNRPYLVNWCCVDFLGFEENPRKRELQPNVVFKFFDNWIRKSGCDQDRLYWHYHPPAFSRAAHHSGTSLHFLPLHYLSLCHRLLDCLDFPAVFRPGYHTERVDLNLFLECWIPFDYGNQISSDIAELPNYGRAQYWSEAPDDWTVYHPSFEEASRPGNLKRWMARCLNHGTDFSVLTYKEVDKAFANAASGKAVILSYTDHDCRDMVQEIESVAKMIEEVATDYRNVVDFKYCSGVEAMRLTQGLPAENPIQMTLSLNGNRLDVKLDKPVFGPQPFLALRSKNGALHHDNFCQSRSKVDYFYIFDASSLPLNQLAEIGVAANDATGNTTIARMNVASGHIEYRERTS